MIHHIVVCDHNVMIILYLYGTDGPLDCVCVCGGGGGYSFPFGAKLLYGLFSDEGYNNFVTKHLLMT